LDMMILMYMFVMLPYFILGFDLVITQLESM